MRHLPQVDCCATLNTFFPTQGGSLAEAFARLGEREAEAVLASGGTQLTPHFETLEPQQVTTALSALTRYRQYALAGAL